MPGPDSLLTLLCLLGVLQGLLLAAALGSLGGEYRRANRLLGLLCLGAATVLALILRPELTLDELAGSLDVPKTHLSQILNETVGQSFLDFLAGYRVRESERLLRDEGSRHLTIEAVGRDSGFRSRSAFYEAFRRVNGMTPAEFRRRQGNG